MSEKNSWRLLGSGAVCVSGREAEGTLHVISSLQDVVGIMKSNPPEAIILTNIAGGTTVAPLLRKVRGVICTIGSTASHIAIVAREFGLACVVGAQNIPFGPDLNGKRVRIAQSGEVYIAGSE